MIPFAANRVRLILVNRRDYPGSTPLLDAELGSPDLDTRAKALARQDLGLSFVARTQGEHPSCEHRPGWETAGRHHARGVVACAHALGWGSSRTPTHFRRHTQGP
jgi:hypothetical protein